MCRAHARPADPCHLDVSLSFLVRFSTEERASILAADGQPTNTHTGFLDHDDAALVQVFGHIGQVLDDDGRLLCGQPQNRQAQQDE